MHPSYANQSQSDRERNCKSVSRSSRAAQHELRCEVCRTAKAEVVCEPTDASDETVRCCKCAASTAGGAGVIDAQAANRARERFYLRREAFDRNHGLNPQGPSY